MSRSLCLDSLSDDELLRRLSTLLDRQHRLESEVVAHVAEVDARRLYRGQACSSMFAYCCEVLHLSEAEAYLRITVARASRRFPVLLDMLADGRLHLSAIAKLAPHLGEDNAEALLPRAVHKSKREIQELVAEVAPRQDVASRMRKLPRARRQPAELGPDRVGRAADPPPARPAVLEPIAPARYKVEFTASAELRDKLCRAQALLRHKLPDGDLGQVIDEAVTLLLGKLEGRRFGKTDAPRKTLEETDTSAASRHVPAAVKRAVYERDQGRCAFVDETSGRRCSCTDPGKLEYHHTTPYAMGGDHGADGVELRCASHNAYQAELDFGPETMDRHRSGASRAREPAAPYSPRPRVPSSASQGRVREAPRVVDLRGAGHCQATHDFRGASVWHCARCRRVPDSHRVRRSAAPCFPWGGWTHGRRARRVGERAGCVAISITCSRRLTFAKGS